MTAATASSMPHVAASFTLPDGQAGEATAVEITLTGLAPAGKVFAQVYASAQAMKARTPVALSFAVDPAGAAQVCTSIFLPRGRYAIAAFQDTRGTGKLETRLGMPTVPYGFSNGARSPFGPPSFEAAAFVVGADPVHVGLPLR